MHGNFRGINPVILPGCAPVERVKVCSGLSCVWVVLLLLSCRLDGLHRRLFDASCFTD